jgi:hypothetical protein
LASSNLLSGKSSFLLSVLLSIGSPPCALLNQHG